MSLYMHTIYQVEDKSPEFVRHDQSKVLEIFRLSPEYQQLTMCSFETSKRPDSLLHHRIVQNINDIVQTLQFENTWSYNDGTIQFVIGFDPQDVVAQWEKDVDLI